MAYGCGVISEGAFREGMKYVVRRSFSADRLVMEDREGLVYGHASAAEVDVSVKDRKHILIEVRSRISKGDVVKLWRIGSSTRGPTVLSRGF